MDTEQRLDDGLEQLSWVECFKKALSIWFHVFLQTVPRIAAVVTVMCFYYLPARLLTKELLQNISFILYELLRNVLDITFFCMSITICITSIFGIRFCLKAIAYSILPGYFITIAVNYIFAGETKSYNLFSNTVSGFIIMLGLLCISKTEQPVSMTEEERVNYALTKDGTPLAIFKGVTGLLVLAVFLVQNLFPIYLESTFYVQVTLRLVVFPLCFSVSRFYQVYVISHLSKEQADRRLIANRLCNMYMHFVSRLYLSNLQTRGANSKEYVGINILSAVLETLDVFTMEYRLHLFYKFRSLFSNIYSKMSYTQQRNRVVSVIPVLDLAEEENRDDRIDYKDIKYYVRNSLDFHSKQLCDNIGAEINSIFIVPLLMYFIYPIYPETHFQTIPCIYESLSLITVQLVFEFLGDVASLTFQLKRKRIRSYTNISKGISSPYVAVSFSAYCTFHIHRIICLFSR